MTTKGVSLPAHAQPTVLELPLYPRSAQALLDLLEDHPYPAGLPLYAVIDLDNLRNTLRAHLQRVAIGE